MEKNYRISSSAAFLMIGTALLFDSMQIMFGIFTVLGAIPIIGVIFVIIGWAISSIFSAYAWLTFFTWFKIKGVGYFSKPSRTIKLAGTVLIEMTPLGILPTWTIFVISTVLETWKEDLKKKTSTENNTYVQA